MCGADGEKSIRLKRKKNKNAKIWFLERNHASLRQLKEL